VVDTSASAAQLKTCADLKDADARGKMSIVGSAPAYPRRGSVAAAPSIPTLRTYGAAGDGVTDDTAAFTSALKGGGGTVLFTQGTYVISPAAVYNLYVDAYGTAALIALTDGVVIKTAGILIGVNPASIGSGLWLNGWPAATGTAANVSATQVPRVRVSDITFLFALVPPPWTGYSIPLLDINSINTSTGIAETGIVSGCRFFGAAGLRVAGSRLRVVDCVSWCTYTGFEFYGGPVQGATPYTSECSMSGCATYNNQVGVMAGVTGNDDSDNDVIGFKCDAHTSWNDGVGISLVNVTGANLTACNVTGAALPVFIQGSQNVVVEGCNLNTQLAKNATANFPAVGANGMSAAFALLAAWQQTPIAGIDAALSYSAGTGFVTYVGPLVPAFENAQVTLAGIVGSGAGGNQNYNGTYNLLQYSPDQTTLAAAAHCTMTLCPTGGQALAAAAGGSGISMSVQASAAGACVVINNGTATPHSCANIAIRSCALSQAVQTASFAASTGAPFVVAMANPAASGFEYTDELTNVDVTGCTGMTAPTAGVSSMLFCGVWVSGGAAASSSSTSIARLQNNSFSLYPASTSPSGNRHVTSAGGTNYVATVPYFALTSQTSGSAVPAGAVAVATTANADANLLA